MAPFFILQCAQQMLRALANCAVLCNNKITVKGGLRVRCGISTSCFYPDETSDALVTLQKAGVQQVEIFLNTFSELEPAYVEKLQALLAAAHTEVLALHPFTSSMETFFFASMYEGRMADGIQLYSRYFDACRTLGIPKTVFHGDYRQTPFPFRRHCENYLRLRELAARSGVELCQENVVRCKCGTPDYIARLREYTHDDVSFVLDVKQMHRAEVPAQQMLDVMQGKISHLHLSDYTPLSDCVAPGAGEMDYHALFSALKKQGFCGSMVVELYRYGFKDVDELTRACRFVEECYAGA